MSPKQSCLDLLVSILRLTAVFTCRNRNKRFYTKRFPLQLSCWNVRTLVDNEKRSERKTAILANELARYNVDIAALSETRFAGEDQLTESDSGYTIFWSGKSEKEKREAGVGFAVKNTLIDKIEQPIGLNDRIMTLRIPLVGDRYLTIISVYAPTLVSSEEVITSFYQALRTVVTGIPKSESVIILGDFNARVGSNSDTWKPIGPFGIGNVNSSGVLLLQLCTELGMVITNTFFHQKEEHKATWFHPQSKHGHLIDFIVCRQTDLRNFCKVKVVRGAECDTDHMMVRAKLKMSIRRKRRFYGVKVPKRIDVSKLKDSGARNALREECDRIDFSGCDWERFKTIVFEKGVETLGLRVIRHQDWFNDNSVEINALLDEKRKSYQKLLSSSVDNRSSYTASFVNVRSKVQRRLRQLKNQWWSDISNQTQTAFDKKDTKRFYSLLHQAFGPKSSSVTPLLAKDGTTKLKTPDDIMCRWHEHFRDLFFNPSEVDDAAVDSIPQRDPLIELDVEPTLIEVIACIKQVNTGKAPGLDGLPVELLLHGGMNVHKAVFNLILAAWSNDPIAQDWIDAIMITLYKGKGKKSLCGSYRGIALLEAVGKVFARLLLNRLEKHVCPSIIPESQSGFRAGRGTVDMIFSARQLVEKCREQCLPLCQVFVDLTKAFDTVNRDALWKVLLKFGCTPAFVDKLRQLHRSMKARVNFNGQLSDQIDVDNGVKQGDIPAPTLFSLYLTAVLWFAFHDCDIGVYFRFRTSGRIFNLRRFQARTLVQESLVRDLLYADDADLVAHSIGDMQSVMDRFSDACTRFGLTISIAKTKVMYTTAPGEVYVEPDINVNGIRLDVVKNFVYLGSTLSDDGSLDAEIKERISKASAAFGRLESRVWSDKDLTLNTKLAVYKTCVLTTLLYASETWTLYRAQTKLLERFHQHCLRRVLSIKWESYTPDTDVLSKAKIESISAIVLRNQMRWAGHLVRMDDARLPKRLFYGELSIGRRPQHKPRKRFKDCVKDNLKLMGIEIDEWETATSDRDQWRRLTASGVKTFESNRVARAVIKRACRKGEPPPTGNIRVWICGICNRSLLSNAGLVNHLKSHQNKRSRVVPIAAPTAAVVVENLICPVCHKVCKSAGGLKRHLKMHGDAAPVTNTISQGIECHLCRKKCNSLAGLKSHLRAHERKDQTAGDEGMALI